MTFHSWDTALLMLCFLILLAWQGCSSTMALWLAAIRGLICSFYFQTIVSFSGSSKIFPHTSLFFELDRSLRSLCTANFGTLFFVIFLFSATKVNNSEVHPLASQTNRTLAFDEIIFRRQIYE